MVRWHHQLDRHEFEQALGVGDGQGGLACCILWGHEESDTTEQLSTPSIKYEQDNHFQVENINAALSSPPQFFLSV